MLITIIGGLRSRGSRGRPTDATLTGRWRRADHGRGGAKGQRLPLRLTIACCTLLVVALLAACGPAAGDAPGTREERVATPAATADPPPAPLTTLREADFASPPFVAELLALAGGGEVPPERVQFEDLTGDGVEEAVVIVESGGTLGDIGVAIYRLVEERAEIAFFQPLAGHVEVRLGLLVTQEGVYGEGDARCCPSRLREVVFGWRDGEFRRLSEQVIDNPQR